MKIIIIVAVIFIIYKVISNKKQSSPPASTASYGDNSSLAKTFLDRSNHIPIKDCQSYYETLRECYEKFGNTMFDTNILVSFLHGYSIDAYMGLTIGDVKRDLEKIARGEPDSNLSSPSADSLINLLASWDKYENLMEITDLNSYYKALREYYAKYGKGMLNLDVIMHFLHTYQLDKKLNKSVNDIKEDFETIGSGLELPYENLPIYEKMEWKELKSKSPNIYDVKTYLDVLKIFYYKFPKYMLDNDVINEFIKTYQLNTKFYIEYEDIRKDLEKIEKQYKAEVAEKAKIIHNYASYLDVLKQYYLQYGDDMFLPSKIQEFIDEYLLDSRYNIQPYEVEKDLEAIKKSTNKTVQRQSKQTQTISNTPPVQPQSKQTQITNNTPSAQSRQTNTVTNTVPSKNNTDTSFYSYVVNMSDTQLINTINGQYKAIKGTWNAAPCMGEYGSIEYAAVLLLWKYAKVNFNRDQESYASLQVTLGDIIGCSFFGMPAGEWSDKKDTILNAHGNILTLKEFGSVYNYLKNNFADEIHQMEFNNGNAKAEVYRQLYTQFVQAYNTMSGYPETFSFYTSKGLKLRNDIQSLDESSTESLLLKKWAWGNEDFMKAVFAFLLSQKWESCSRKLAEDAYVDIPPKLTDNFYSSSYGCPTCGRHMYKTVFSIGAESPIKVDDEVVLMKRIFTCPTCQTFYTPLSGRKLSYGMCYCLEAQTQYDLLLKIFDNQGTTDGRPDA